MLGHMDTRRKEAGGEARADEGDANASSDDDQDGLGCTLASG